MYQTPTKEKAKMKVELHTRAYEREGERERERERDLILCAIFRGEPVHENTQIHDSWYQFKQKWCCDL
jgi:hypothetical protein